MKLTWKQVAQRVLETLTEDERKSSVVYLDEKELSEGSKIRIDHKDVILPWNGALAFVDRKPEANWGHPSRYLLINLQTGEMDSLDAQFPFFLRDVPETLRVIWKAETVPDWTIIRR